MKMLIFSAIIFTLKIRLWKQTLFQYILDTEKHKIIQPNFSFIGTA